MAEEIQEEVEVQGPGAMLKARRESLQLSIEEIAEKLHLRPAVVAELEEDVIDHSVSMTFTKGYVRLYAKHLEMDPAPVLAAFDELANPIKQPAKLQSFSQRVAKQASDTRLMMLSYFILFAIIAMAVIWWFQQPEESSEENSSVSDANAQQIVNNQQAEPASSPLSAVITDEPEQPSPVDGSAVESAIEPTTTEPESSIATTAALVADESETVGTSVEAAVQDNGEESREDNTADESGLVDTSEPQNLVSEESDFGSDSNDVERELAEQTDTSSDAVLPAFGRNNTPDTDFGLTIASEQSVNSAESLNTADFPENFGSAEPITQELVFTFEQDCWMNLTDATGENIAYGVKNAGRVMPVSGIPPFEVVLGAPQGVAITVDGVPFDMSAFPAGRTARFIIGSEFDSAENSGSGVSPE